MKAKISLAAIVMAGFILFAACGSTSSSSSTSKPSSSTSSATTSVAYNAGRDVGSSMLSLYNQYKSAGKLDMQNMNTYLQILTLATAIQNNKDNLKTPNTTFYTQFVSGAVLGTQNKLSTSNAGVMINTLMGLNLGGITSAGSGSNVSTSTATNVLSGLTTILGLFGK